MRIKLINFILFATFLNIAIYNIPLIEYAINNTKNLDSRYLIIFELFVILIFVHAFFLFLLSTISNRLLKAFVILSFLGNSIALYFIDTYHVILDRTMMGNVFNTNKSEVFAFFDIKIFIYLFIFGILPALLIYKIKIAPIKRLKRFAYGVLFLVVALIISYINSTTWLWLDKNGKVLGALVEPYSYIVNSIRFKLKEAKKHKKYIKLPDAKFKNSDEIVVVLVIGESARASNFSLYGYKKDTNPKLKKDNVLVLKNSYSYATYTTASVGAILSVNGKDDSFEPLTNYLYRMGAYVQWRSNNWGEPRQIVAKYYKSSDLRANCKVNCEYDEVLLTNLKEDILNAKEPKKLFVLHTAGSHGPTYFKKYPKSFEKFKPVCKSVDLKECSKDELFNAYDNSIYYTDYFLDKTISILKSLHKKAVLIYLSDHGESLGEYGLYLHGTPYAIAPKFQKEIPFIIWESKEFLASKSWQKPYVKRLDSYSQANVFHTIIGLMDLNSSVYKPNLDILKEDK